MKADEFVNKFPLLYHIADSNAWDSIYTHGLRSTSELLDLFEIEDTIKESLLRGHRSNSVEIIHPRYGTAIVRDQKPMSLKGLNKCLQETTPSEWFAILNSFCFLWPTLRRRDTFLNARAYRDSEHLVIEFDSERLINTITTTNLYVSRINSGSTVYNPLPRGKGVTFIPFDSFDLKAMSQKYGKANAIAEIAVKGMVSNVKSCAARVALIKGSSEIKEIWRSS
jgi:hypothetical protein